VISETTLAFDTAAFINAVPRAAVIRSSVLATAFACRLSFHDGALVCDSVGARDGVDPAADLDELSGDLRVPPGRPCLSRFLRMLSFLAAENLFHSAVVN
jgi:hypothetical protein